GQKLVHHVSVEQEARSAIHKEPVEQPVWRRHHVEQFTLRHAGDRLHNVLEYFLETEREQGAEQLRHDGFFLRHALEDLVNDHLTHCLKIEPVDGNDQLSDEILEVRYLPSAVCRVLVKPAVLRSIRLRQPAVEKARVFVGDLVQIQISVLRLVQL